MTAYRAAPPETLRIVPLDALTLIYHRASGITHVVDAPVPEMLEALAADELTVDQLLT
ncbi:HPr-rel-A system PqqD family peptide chaperone, partial [Pandoraea nosoerga]|nr:HPr-rel-A system PqqD family peptide chaperone [Pandoraea nosoerga]